MNLSDVVIMALLLVGIVGFLAIAVAVLQYYTVTKETQRMMEDAYLSKMECDYSMQQLEDRESKRVTDQQITESREQMVEKDLATLLQESEQEIIAEREKRLVESGMMVDPEITDANWENRRQEYAANHQKAFEQKIFELRNGAEFKPVDNGRIINIKTN